MPNQIKLLPEHIIDQIKAGEVIERPASLVKELLENALDAGATKINIQIEENGLDLISIEDNGAGIEFESLPYAFCRHATSKIESFEDIYKLNSFGFRGEALASICSIARLTCITSPANKQGGKIVIHGGEQKSLTPIERDTSGTSIFIKDLFFNTPARLKFIKSKTSESNAIKRIINSFILGNPQTTFKIQLDAKEKEIYPALKSEEIEKRVSKIFFKKNETQLKLFHIDSGYEEYKLEGYISEKSSKGNAGKAHYLFVNNRLFNDIQLHRTIMRTMESFWPQGETGHYFLQVKVPANELDVNVHPGKTQVKFFKPSVIFSLFSSSIQKALQQSSSPSRSTTDHHGFSNTDFSNSFQREEEVETSTNLFKVSNKHAIFRHENIINAVNSSKLVGYYIYQNIFRQFPVKESDITPLLISEPYAFSCSIDIHLPFLKDAGFELDRLDEKTIVLRTIPSYLDIFETKEIVRAVLDFASKYSDALSFEKFKADAISRSMLEHFSLTQIPFGEEQLKICLDSLSYQQLINHQIIRPLDDNTIKNVLNS